MTCPNCTCTASDYLSCLGRVERAGLFSYHCHLCGTMFLGPEMDLKPVTQDELNQLGQYYTLDGMFEFVEPDGMLAIDWS